MFITIDVMNFAKCLQTSRQNLMLGGDASDMLFAVFASRCFRLVA